jgi:hypothetical protein
MKFYKESNARAKKIKKTCNSTPKSYLIPPHLTPKTNNGDKTMICNHAY